MESRKKLAFEVLEGRLSLSEACRQAGVTRKTGGKWVERAREVGVENLSELSRAPKTVRRKTETSVEDSLLELKASYPEWGARKLVVRLRKEKGIELPKRTADRILERNGLTSPRRPQEPLQRFERDSCGSLLQMDFKGLPKSCPYSLLTVLDDYGRFCLSFQPLKDKKVSSVWEALWRMFERHGLPDSMLMDNGDCWGSHGWKGSVTKLEVKLMLLGIRPTHGRPYHPQTQGKVERFHRTAKLEVGTGLVQPSVQQVEPILERFVDRYNWVRPHDALNGEVPGSRYAPFPRPRPNQLPTHHIPEGAESRSVDMCGRFSFKGTEYDIGQALYGQRVVLQPDELGIQVRFQGFVLAHLKDL